MKRAGSQGQPIEVSLVSLNVQSEIVLLKHNQILKLILNIECSCLKKDFFTEKCHNNIKSKYYVRPKSDAICFAIHHFAGRVVYQADGFLEKNRNFLPPEVVQLMRQSQYDIIRFLFQCPITKTGNLYSPLQGDIDSRSLDSPNSGDTRVNRFRI